MRTVTSFLGEYLRARRALISPADIGLATLDTRRVPGLRRNEVAHLAGISQEYYLRLEQGRDRRPSHQVLTSLARALRLDADAMEHMLRLSQIDADDHHGRVPVTVPASVDAGLTALVDNLTEVPALVMTANQDVVAANTLALAIRPGLVPGANFLLRVFSDQARTTVLDWSDNASRSLANLRFYGDPRDARFRELVATLSERDEQFRAMWARHDVEQQVTWASRIDLDGEGPVDLTCHSLYVPGSGGRFLMTLTAEPGTRAEVALRTLIDRTAQATAPSVSVGSTAAS